MYIHSVCYQILTLCYANSVLTCITVYSPTSNGVAAILYVYLTLVLLFMM